MTNPKDLFRATPAPQTPWERTKAEALHILDEENGRRSALTAALKEARLARDQAELPAVKPNLRSRRKSASKPD
ncbi:hypothetical protein [Paracoccus laeviglucosivorans]|uniref:Uncharacterized protein n=1 Tax=Paracoccus laeviglucosivorans TaxID=1197861 RepID=A0A521FN16_9RHOB|nr:hypothetical protein [Paracoccus laeviglucosivorans]SMO97603.1 hypothetical protein SAMN06265221_12833 [Paracoccus laeviglucosivorans]